MKALRDNLQGHLTVISAGQFTRTFNGHAFPNPFGLGHHQSIEVYRNRNIMPHNVFCLNLLCIVVVRSSYKSE